MPVFIYCLKDPTTGDVRYIGKANNPKKRFIKHLRESSKRKNHLGNWLRSLKGEKPILAILHEVAEHEFWVGEERRYISCARALGVDLVNATGGGEGGSGPRSMETRAKISAKKRGVLRTAEACAAMSVAHVGVKLSPEHRAAQSVARKGVPWSPARRAAQERRKSSA